MQLFLITILYIVVILGMIVSLRSYFEREVKFTTRIMFYTTHKVVKGDKARKFGLYSFLAYFIMFLTLLAYSIFGMQLGYIGIPVCISSFVLLLFASWVVKND